MARIHRLSVDISGKGHPISVGPGLLAQTAEFLPQDATAVLLVSDDQVWRLYGKRVLEALGPRWPASWVRFPAGEASKTPETLASVQDAMFQAGLDRQAVVLALGGGVTTDLAGFAAATYMRGIRYVNLPTSLLAMVDASVGGKTGVNTRWGKNLLGAFHQPWAVAADTATLATLPAERLADGLAEMLKHGFALDAGHFHRLLDAGPDFLRDPDLAAELVAESVALKAQVVQADPQESGLRRVLNFGHTVGHALERALSWQVGHGRAVAAGMWAEARCAEALGLLSTGDRRLLEQALNRFGLKWCPALDPDRLVALMAWDKKNRAGRIRMALPVALGRMAEADGQWALEVEAGLVRRVLADLVIA